MTPDLIERLERQLGRFQVCRIAAGISPPDAPVSPKDALQFAEDLMLCRSEDLAMQQMHAHPGQTIAFERMATAFLKLATHGTAEDTQPVPAGTIFYELAGAVQEYAEILLENFPDEFE
jgi:hypothetical protein